MSETQYLKNARSGRVFIKTEELSKRSDMVSCTAEGKVNAGFVAEAESAAGGVQVSKYVGFVKDGEPGRLFNYTEQLANKAGAIFIDDAAQWKGDLSNVQIDYNDVPEVDEIPVPPAALSRNAPDAPEIMPPVPAAEGDENELPGISDGLTVPDVSGIDDKDAARSILCQWAFKNYEVNLNRTFGVDRMKAECDSILASLTDDVNESGSDAA